MDISEIETAMLEFEATAPRSVGAKEVAIRERFKMSPVRYHQRLNALLDSPAALAAEPVLVNRLLRVRDARRAVPETES